MGRQERGANLLKLTERPSGQPYDLTSGAPLDPEALAATPAASAMQLAAAAQQVVGAHAVSNLTEEGLHAQFQDMLASMKVQANLCIELISQ